MDAICEAAIAPSGCILASADLYGGSHRYLKHMQERGAFSVRYVDFTCTFSLEKAQRMLNGCFDCISGNG
jgi:O-acetylhomoserine/O-acetylserine sulfhydrylase-like pyridoxal-dependent enzyme